MLNYLCAPFDIYPSLPGIQRPDDGLLLSSAEDASVRVSVVPAWQKAARLLNTEKPRSYPEWVRCALQRL